MECGEDDVHPYVGGHLWHYYSVYDHDSSLSVSVIKSGGRMTTAFLLQRMRCNIFV